MKPSDTLIREVPLPKGHDLLMEQRRGLKAEIKATEDLLAAKRYQLRLLERAVGLDRITEKC